MQDTGFGVQAMGEVTHECPACSAGVRRPGYCADCAWLHEKYEALIGDGIREEAAERRSRFQELPGRVDAGIGAMPRARMLQWQHVEFAAGVITAVIAVAVAVWLTR